MVDDFISDPTGIVRVKIWTADGRIVYSDEPRAHRRRPSRSARRSGRCWPISRFRADISDLSEEENEFETGLGSDKLLEVYGPVWTPNGTPLLFETYRDYERRRHAVRRAVAAASAG